MTHKAIQDHYPDHVSHCYGCGRLNEHGLQIKSFWEDNEAVCSFHPEPYHISFPETFCGGLIAAVMECHAMATAIASWYRAEGREIGTDPRPGFLAASLHVDFVKRTPMGVPLEFHATPPSADGRKLLVRTTLLAQGEERAHGEVLIIQVPWERMLGAA